jgi:hypothetical protein
MCSMRATLILTLALCAGGRVHAQTHEELQARAAAHRARIDSLRPLYDSAQAQAQRSFVRQARAEARRAGTLDTVGIGPFLVVGRPRDVAATAPLFERAWDDYTPLVGGAAARLEGAVFFVRRDNPGTGRRGFTTRPQHYNVDLPSIIRYGDRMRAVRAAIGAPLRELLPPAVQQWVGEGRFGAARELDRAYRELAIGASRGAAQCHDGDLTSCAGVLGLSADTAWLRFYTSAQLREMERRGRSRDLLPLSHDTRVVLFEHALMRGGDGALERMIADSTVDVQTALTAASRSDLTQLLESWRQTVHGARPGAAAWLSGTLLVTLFWIGVLIVIAKRSTRWRIG